MIAWVVMVFKVRKNSFASILYTTSRHLAGSDCFQWGPCEDGTHIVLQGNASLLDWELWRNLVRSEIDFAVDIPSVEDPQICHQSLMVDDYVCVVRHGHSILRHELTLERSMALQHIHVSSRRYRRDDRSGAEYAAIPRGQI